MKYFLKMFLCLFTFVAGSAWADILWFKTIPEAQKYCPAISELKYNAINPSQGSILGANSSRSFISYNANTKSNLTMRPETLLPNNLVGNVSFRFATLGYGYINNQTIACFYSYPGYTGVNVALLMISG